MTKTKGTGRRAPGARRRFLQGTASAALGSALFAAPMVASAQQSTAIRLQSGFPQKDIQHEFVLDLAKKVNDMSGGRLKIEVLPAGAVVKPFDVLDAVSRGILDAGVGVPAWWYGKNSALSLWGTGPSFGMDANLVIAWQEYGGGKQLLDEIYRGIGANVVSFFMWPMATQPLGWFKKPVTKPEDFKGLKFRTVGLSIELFTELGAAVVALPGGEIVPAMERGLLDAAEFNNPSSDRLLGFQDVSKVYMLRSYHQVSETLEVLFNRKLIESLPTDLRSIIQYATQAACADSSWKAADRFSKDYLELNQKHGVKFYRTPDAVLEAQLKAWDRVVKKKSDENPLFKKVVESQKAFAQRVVRWTTDSTADSARAYRHAFGGKV